MDGIKNVIPSKFPSSCAKEFYVHLHEKLLFLRDYRIPVTASGDVVAWLEVPQLPLCPSAVQRKRVKQFCGKLYLLFLRENCKNLAMKQTPHLITVPTRFDECTTVLH